MHAAWLTTLGMMGKSATLESNDESEADDYIELVFAAGSCPDCETSGEPGACPNCGGEIPEAADIGPAANARLKALGPLADRARGLRASFDQLPANGVIPIAPDQFVSVLSESELFGAVSATLGVVEELKGVDLTDTAKVGTAVRTMLDRHLERVEDLLLVSEEVATFDVEGSGADLRQRAIDSGEFGADIASTLIGALTAPTYSGAKEEASKFEALLAPGFPMADPLNRALKAVEEGTRADVSERVSLAIGRPGNYVDPNGNLDVTLVFLAFAEEPEPFPALEAQALSYFGRLTGGTLGGEGAGAILVAPLVLVAAADQPLRAHRAVRMVTESLDEAWRQSPAAVRELVKRSTAQGPILFAALERVARAAETLASDEEDERAVETIMQAYTDLAETSFRMFGWLALGAESVASGNNPTPELQPPMLGEMQQRLEAGGPLARLMADSIYPKLRNAKAHSQYRWVAAREVVEDIRTKQEWSVDDLLVAVRSLVSCLAGADAGYGSFVVSKRIDLGAPDWLADGAVPEALKVIATLCFGAYGFAVLSIREGGEVVVIEKPDQVDPARLIPPLAGLIPLAPRVEHLRLVTTEGEPLIDVGVAAMKAAIGASPAVKDVAVMEVTFESCVRIGMNREDAARDFAILAAKIVAFSGLGALAEGSLGPSAFWRVGDRLAYVRQQVTSTSGAVTQKSGRCPSASVESESRRSKRPEVMQGALSG